MNQTKGVDSVINSFFAGTRSGVSDRIHRASMALLASVCLSAAGPLLETREKEPFGTGLDTLRTWVFS